MMFSMREHSVSSPIVVVSSNQVYCKVFSEEDVEILAYAIECVEESDPKVVVESKLFEMSVLVEVVKVLSYY